MNQRAAMALDEEQRHNVMAEQPSVMAEQKSDRFSQVALTEEERRTLMNQRAAMALDEEQRHNVMAEQPSVMAEQKSDRFSQVALTEEERRGSKKAFFKAAPKNPKA